MRKVCERNENLSWDDALSVNNKFTWAMSKKTSFVKTPLRRIRTKTSLEFPTERMILWCFLTDTLRAAFK